MLRRRSDYRMHQFRQARNRAPLSRPVRCAVEALEDRTLLASYTWTPAAGTLVIDLGTNDQMTIAEASGTRKFHLTTGGGFASNGGTAASGNGTSTLTFATADNIGTSITVNNAGDTSPSNESVTFLGGSLTSGAIAVDLTQTTGTASAISFTTAATNFSTSAVTLQSPNTINEGTGGSISATTGTLALAGATGIGASTNPLVTAVGALVARAGDGIFLSNTGDLTIGFPGDPFQGVTDVSPPGDISLTNNGSINVTNSGEPIQGIGNVTVSAVGVSSDILTGGNQDAIQNFGPGTVSLTAGRNIVVGTSTSYGNVNAARFLISGPANLVMDAGQDVIVQSMSNVDAYGAAFASSPGATIAINAGGNINFADHGGTVFTNDGGAITMMAGGALTDRTFDPILTNNLLGNGPGANITLIATTIFLESSINAGSAAVTLTPTSGDVEVLGPGGSIRGGSITQTSGAAVSIYTGVLLAMQPSAAIQSAGTAGIHLTGNDFLLENTISTVGSFDVTDTGTATLLASLTASTVTKNGPGAFFVDSGGNAISSAITVNAGTLGGTGIIPAPVSVQGGATLTAGNNAPGILTTATDTLSNSSSFSVDLGGTVPGDNANNYSQLVVNGDVNLNNATLVASLTFNPHSAIFTLITATGNITGQFAQGQVIVLNGITYSIAYLPHSVMLVPSADASVHLSGPSAVTEGGTGTYTYTIANSGPGAAQNLTLTAPIPAGAAFVSASFGGLFFSIPPTAYNPTTGVVSLGSVPAGTGGTLALTVTLPEENPGVTFSASIATSTLDTNLSNNTATFTTQVNDAPLTAHGGTVSPTQNRRTFDSVTVATFTDANLLATAADFTATVDWGDGTVGAAQIVPNSDGSFSVIASHNYKNLKAKSYALVVQIMDVGGSVVSADGTATL